MSTAHDLPRCPNYVESNGAEDVCGRSDLVLYADAALHWIFICRTCKLFWPVSKPKERARAKWQAAADRMAKATEADLEAARRPKHFIAPRGGWAQ